VLELGARLGQLLFRRTDAPPRLFAAREDLKQLAVESERQGALTSSERAMIHNVVDFRTVKVADVMVPRKQVVAARPETTVPKLLELSAQTGVDRVPVMTENGSALGLVNVFDLLLDQSPPRELAHYVGHIVSAAEAESAYRIIRRLRAAHSTLAAVFDDQRRLTGIVTVEDLVRRLVQSA
jgi:CBS domain containing-hemolysin-like protein